MTSMTTILLVEDAFELAEVIHRELQGFGYDVVHAGDGLSALQLHARHDPDLIILDWMLPGLDGLEVLRQIRQTSPVPILMLTARGEEADRVIGLEVGADDYLTKPFSMRELVASAVGVAMTIIGVMVIQSDYAGFYPYTLPVLVANGFSDTIRPLNILEEGVRPVKELLVGSVGGLIAAVLAGWEVTRRDVL